MALIPDITHIKEKTCLMQAKATRGEGRGYCLGNWGSGSTLGRRYDKARADGNVCAAAEDHPSMLINAMASTPKKLSRHSASLLLNYDSVFFIFPLS